MDEFVFDVEIDDEEEKDPGDDLDATVAEVESTRAEKRKEKNRRRNLKRREKARERIIAQEMAVQAGAKTRREVEEENIRRRAEGMASRKKGRLLAERKKEVESEVAEWKRRVESGEIQLQREMSAEDIDARKQRQAAHVARKRAERQRLRRQRTSVWGRIGRTAVFGDDPASFLALQSPSEQVWPPAGLANQEEEDDGRPKERQVAAVVPRIEDIVELR